jgi:hypothetical protein
MIYNMSLKDINDYVYSNDRQCYSCSKQWATTFVKHKNTLQVKYVCSICYITYSQWYDFDNEHIHIIDEAIDYNNRMNALKSFQ